MPLEYFDSEFVEAFFEAGMTDKGTEIARQMTQNAVSDMEYYVRLYKQFKNSAEYDRQICLATVQWLADVANKYHQKDLNQEIEKAFENMYTQYMQSGDTGN